MHGKANVRRDMARKTKIILHLVISLSAACAGIAPQSLHAADSAADGQTTQTIEAMRISAFIVSIDRSENAMIVSLEGRFIRFKVGKENLADYEKYVGSFVVISYYKYSDGSLIVKDITLAADTGN